MLEPLFEKIQTQKTFELRQKNHAPIRRNPTASDISHCAREITLSILHYDQRPVPSDELLARFEVGNTKESLNISKLMTIGLSAGFQVVQGQQDCEHRDLKGRLIVTGHIDGKVSWEGGLYPFDHKTMHPLVYARVNTVDDFSRHKYLYKYLHQLWTYLYLNNEETGFLWLDNLLGDWKFIEVPLDYERMEGVLKKCEAAVEAVEKVRAGEPEEKALPAFHTDPTVCTKCWAFKRLCLPPFAATGEGMTVIENAELAEKIRRRAELDESASEYDALDREIKGVLKPIMKDGMIFIIGDYLVKANERSRKTYTVPAQKYLMLQIEGLNEKGTEK